MDLFSAIRPRSCKLQFSLRLLLLAFSAFAIGFPIWYRWPYQEALEAPSGARRITTWQRQWGGSRVKHGQERWMVADEILGSVMYRHGLRHGPYRSEGVRGQYINDLKDGLWTEPFRTSTWRLGKLNGPTEIRVPAPAPEAQKRWRSNNKFEPGEARTIKLLFEDGRLTGFDGKPVMLAGRSRRVDCSSYKRRMCWTTACTASSASPRKSISSKCRRAMSFSIYRRCMA